jgi:hypothetical protein
MTALNVLVIENVKNPSSVIFCPTLLKMNGPLLMPVRMPNAQGLIRTTNPAAHCSCRAHAQRTGPYSWPRLYVHTYIHTHTHKRPSLRPTAHALHPIPPQSFMRATNPEAYFDCPSTYGVAKEREDGLYSRGGSARLVNSWLPVIAMFSLVLQSHPRQHLHEHAFRAALLQNAQANYRSKAALSIILLEGSTSKTEWICEH